MLALALTAGVSAQQKAESDAAIKNIKDPTCRAQAGPFLLPNP